MLSAKHRRPLVPALVACAFVVLVLAVYAVHHSHHIRAVKAGDRVPAFTMTDLQGTPVTMQPLQHGVTVYNIFTSWCPGCREETPAFARFADRLRARGVQVVGIDQGEPATSIETFEQQFNVRYPIVVDTDHLSNAIFGARVIPQTVVVKDGVVKAIAVGPLTPEDVEAMIGTV